MPSAFGTYWNVLNYYRPEGVKAFARRYTEGSRDVFCVTKKIKIASQDPAN